MFAAFLEDQNAGGDAGAVEDIGRQADDGIEPVLLLNQVAANMRPPPRRERARRGAGPPPWCRCRPGGRAYAAQRQNPPWIWGPACRTG